MRIYQENITADDADVLAGTNLDVLEAGGQLDIAAISSQADTLITITGPDAEPIVVGSELPNEARAIRPADDVSYSLPIRSGGHYVVNVDIVTAATVQFVAIYRKAGVDF